MKFQFKVIAVLCAAMTFTACGLTVDEKAKQQAAIAEQRRIECLDKICLGDKEPMLYDHARYQLFKRGGKFFLGPREYGFYEGTARFYWPSKHPTGRSGDFPEKGRPWADVGIEVFIEAAKQNADGAREFLEQVESNNWVASRKMIRPDLEQITQRNEAPGHERTIYVATELKGQDGKPPVAQCSHAFPSDGGGTSFMWKPGFKVWARWNQRQCVDWPEIYAEIINVLNQVKEVQP